MRSLESDCDFGKLWSHSFGSMCSSLDLFLGTFQRGNDKAGQSLKATYEGQHSKRTGALFLDF